MQAELTVERQGAAVDFSVKRLGSAFQGNYGEENALLLDTHFFRCWELWRAQMQSCLLALGW